MKNFPPPSAEALQHSEKLTQLIREEIKSNNNAITFKRFMELALYAPGLGYYSAGSHKLGEQGDFVTAPIISSLFSRCIARQCEQILKNITHGNILELGAGSGVMAADLLLELESRHILPEKYFILEVSADLQERQKEFLQKKIPHLFSRVEWLQKLPSEKFNGIILANEVLDAMPIHCFQQDKNDLKEVYVSWEENKFISLLKEPSADLTNYCEKLSLSSEATSYQSEINFFLPLWLKSISECLGKGLILLIDYGFPRHEYYHASRFMGTLMCHYRHQAHTDPLVLVGLQDITAHVDFTHVAESAIASNLKVEGFTNQAAFLINCGLLDMIESQDDIRHQIDVSKQIQKLTSPEEMGELFKVMALTQNLDEIELLGFVRYDQRGRL